MKYVEEVDPIKGPTKLKRSSLIAEDGYKITFAYVYDMDKGASGISMFASLGNEPPALWPRLEPQEALGAYYRRVLMLGTTELVDELESQLTALRDHLNSKKTAEQDKKDELLMATMDNESPAATGVN